MRRGLYITLLALCFGNISFAQEPKLMLQVGHSQNIRSVSFSPDGKKIVTAGDFSAKIWEAASGKLLADLIGHKKWVITAAFSPDGKKIVTRSSDSTSKIWDAETGVQLIELRENNDRIKSAQFSPDGKKIITNSQNGVAKIRDAASGSLLVDLSEQNRKFNSVRFSPGGKIIITTSSDSSVKVWDASLGHILYELKRQSNGAIDAQFSPDEINIMTVSKDNYVRIWDARAGIELLTLKGEYGEFSKDGKKIVTTYTNNFIDSTKIWDAVTGNLLLGLKGWYYQFSPDANKIVTNLEPNGLKNSEVLVWDAITGKQLLSLEGEGGEFSPDRKQIVVVENLLRLGADDNAFKYMGRVYDVTSGKSIYELKGRTNAVYSIDYTQDGSKIIARYWENFRTWNTHTGKPPATARDKAYSINFSPDGKQYLTYNDSSVNIWNATTEIILNNFPSNDKINFAQFSPDSKKIAVVYKNKTDANNNNVKIWDVNSGNLLTIITKPGVFYADKFFFSPEGNQLITLSKDSIAKVWDCFTGKLLFVLNKNTEKISSVKYSPDGKNVLITSGTVASIWDAGNGTFLIDLKGHEKKISLAQFSPDGKKILTASDDSTTKVWDVVTGNLIFDLKGHEYTISDALFSPDGKRIITTAFQVTRVWNAEKGTLLATLKGLHPTFSPDGEKILTTIFNEVNVWDTYTGKQLADIKGHNGIVVDATFSPNGKTFITGSNDGVIKIWDTESCSLIYTYIAIDKNDYLILDKDNHYDGTEAARRLLYFTCATEVIELEQVKDQLWVPNLAERIMSGETINAQKLSDLNICNLTPVVETIEQTALQYRFQITPRLGGLGATIVNVNGIEVKRYTPQQLIQQKENYQLAIDKRELQKFFVAGKENSIVVKSLTAKNSIRSRSVSIHEKANEKNEALPNLYAMVVGVSDYKGEAMDLKYAAKDAMDMGNALEASAKKLLNTDGKEHVFLTRIHTAAGRDKFPEKNAIKQAFAEIAGKAQANDILLVFFAGHGVTETEKKQFYFLTADASTNTVTGALKEVGISTEELTDWIRPQVMKAQKRILIFDACNSGQAIREMISVGKESQNFVASRGDDNSNQVKAVEKLNERSGMFILSASASDQKAYEMGKYNQGALTYSLLKAIKEEPDILEDRKYLNLSRWFNAAEKSVNELARETGARQQPQIVSTTNFNIGVVDEEVRNKIVLPFEKPMFTRSDIRNTETTIDNLKLRSLVDKKLIDLSDQDKASLMYSPEYEGQNVYQLSGSYTVNEKDIAVTVIITQGGTEIKTKFEVRGTVDQLNSLSEAIIAKITGWLMKK